jgi:integrase
VKIVAAIGFEVVPHDLRHSVTTRLFTRDGWTVPAAATYMGHSDPKVTLKIYTHLTAAALPRPSAIEGR